MSFKRVLTGFTSLPLVLVLSIGTVGCATDEDLLSNSSAVDLDVPATATRITKMEIRDPHLYLDSFFCGDITTVANGLLDQSLSQDKDTPPDGFLDINVLPIFTPLAPTAPSSGLRLDVGAQCTVPAASTTCKSTGTQIVDSVAHNQATGTCLGTLPGTTFSGYTPAITVPAAPCFASDAATIDVSLGSVNLRLQAAHIAGRYGATAGQVQDGLLRGFMSLEQARASVFPANLPLVGGKNLAQLLTGGDTNCTRPGGGNDLDTGPDGVTKGWYFYLNYTAAPVAYSPAVAPATPAL